MNVVVEDWKEEAVILARTDVLSWRQIAEMLKVPKSTVSDYLRDYFSMSKIPDVSQDRHNNERILFISDPHAPYNHPKLIPFLEGLKVRYDPTRIILLGDEVDYHALSFHDSDPDLPSAGDELERARQVIAEMHSLFPQADVIDSNHGSMVFRKAKHHGIPMRAIRSYNEVLGVGDGWVWHNDLVLDMSPWDKPDVYVHHGKSAQVVRTSQTMSMSAVQGHYHEGFSITYWANPKGLYFGMQCGCLIDDKSYAFNYNNVNLKRPIIGTGLIIEGIPVLEAMNL